MMSRIRTARQWQPTCQSIGNRLALYMCCVLAAHPPTCTPTPTGTAAVAAPFNQRRQTAWPMKDWIAKVYMHHAPPNVDTLGQFDVIVAYLKATLPQPEAAFVADACSALLDEFGAGHLVWGVKGDDKDRQDTESGHGCSTCARAGASGRAPLEIYFYRIKGTYDERGFGGFVERVMGTLAPFYDDARRWLGVARMCQPFGVGAGLQKDRMPPHGCRILGQ